MPPQSGFVWSEASGQCKNYRRHAEHCPHRLPDRLRQITAAERANKENKISATAESELSQSAGIPHSREAADSSLTDVTALFVSHRCAARRPATATGNVSG